MECLSQNVVIPARFHREWEAPHVRSVSHIGETAVEQQDKLSKSGRGVGGCGPYMSRGGDRGADSASCAKSSANWTKRLAAIDNRRKLLFREG